MATQDVAPALTYVGIYSNNPSRVFLAQELFGVEGTLSLKSHTDFGGLQAPEFLKINPEGKVPALIIEGSSGISTLYESQVILDYLVDRFDWGPKLDAGSPELRAKVRLLIQTHDLYLASPNSTQPGHFANQGCLYKPMPLPYRATVYKEFRKQLAVITDQMFDQSASVESYEGNYLVAGKLTLADVVIFTSYVFFKASSKLSLPEKLDAALAYNADSRWEKWAAFVVKTHPAFDKVGGKIAQWCMDVFGQPTRSPALKVEIEGEEGQAQDWGV